MGSFLLTPLLAILCSCLVLTCCLPVTEEVGGAKDKDVKATSPSPATDAGSMILNQIVGVREAAPEVTDTSSDKPDENRTAEDRDYESLYEIASKLNLRKFIELIKKVYLQPLLAGNGPYTLFAPTDEAFANLTSPVIEKLGSSNSEAIEEFIINHMVKGIHTSQSLRLRKSLVRLKTIGGIDIKFRGDKGKFYVNDIEVEERDIMGANGVIHTIKGVIFLPETVLGNDEVTAGRDSEHKVVTDTVGIIDWPSQHGNITSKQGEGLPSPSPGDGYDGFGPSSINPNDYIPPEQGHVDAIHEMVEEWLKFKKELEQKAKEAKASVGI